MIGECDCCRASGVKVKKFAPNAIAPHLTESMTLCEICGGNTMVAIWNAYPNQHDGDAIEILKMIAYVGHLILKELRK